MNFALIVEGGLGEIMAVVKQCDLCMNIFQIERNEYMRKPNGACICYTSIDKDGVPIASFNQKYGDIIFDLCPDCIEKVKRFIESGGRHV